MPSEMDCSGEGFAIRSSGSREQLRVGGLIKISIEPMEVGDRGVQVQQRGEEERPTLEQRACVSLCNLCLIYVIQRRTYGVRFTFGSLSTCTTTDKTLTPS